ncbi:MAG TPA: branched-chain amino acid ABC transporter permease [Dehalococcoidales bacterium]|nr:branched-chain amino acid ABC transporter permease [Dehalococcoidales bacterium]
MSNTLPCGTRNYEYGQDMAIFRTRTQWVLLIAFLIVLFCVPLFISNFWLNKINLIGITLIAATGLNILVGYCGQLSIGHVGFMAVGAYTSAILTGKLGLPFPVAFLCAGLMAGIIGLIFAIPSVRVKGFYLAITSIAAQFIIIYVIQKWTDMTGGTNGLVVADASLFGYVFASQTSFFYLIAVVAVACIFFAKNLGRTRTGRAFIAIRDNDLAAEVMGINLFYYKMLAFFIGCFMAGIAGSLLAHWSVAISPDNFSFSESILYVGMIIIGGLGTTLGPILGVVLIRLLQVGVTQATPWLHESLTWMSTGFASGITPMLFGLIIVVFLIFEPRGLAHRWNLFKASYRLWPFSY